MPKPLFSKKALKLLEENQVSPDQYVAWADTDFGKKAYLTSLIFGIGIFLFCNKQGGQTCALCNFA